MNPMGMEWKSNPLHGTEKVQRALSPSRGEIEGVMPSGSARTLVVTRSASARMLAPPPSPYKTTTVLSPRALSDRHLAAEEAKAAEALSMDPTLATRVQKYGPILGPQVKPASKRWESKKLNIMVTENGFDYLFSVPEELVHNSQELYNFATMSGLSKKISDRAELAFRLHQEAAKMGWIYAKRMDTKERVYVESENLHEYLVQTNSDDCCPCF